MISDAHVGLKNAIAQVLGCPWQRCRVHFPCEVLGHARPEQQPILAALLRPLLNADTGEQARSLARDALDRLRKPLPKVAALLEAAAEDLLAFYAFLAAITGRGRAGSTRTNASRARPGRRNDVVGIFPNDRALIGSPPAS